MYNQSTLINRESEAYKIITNPDLLAVNQDPLGIQVTLEYRWPWNTGASQFLQFSQVAAEIRHTFFSGSVCERLLQVNSVIVSQQCQNVKYERPKK